MTGPPGADLRITSDAARTTVLVPLRGGDVTLSFDWIGGRGPRTLRLVGHEVAHRTVQSQGEFSAP